MLTLPLPHAHKKNTNPRLWAKYTMKYLMFKGMYIGMCIGAIKYSWKYRTLKAALLNINVLCCTLYAYTEQHMHDILSKHTHYVCAVTEWLCFYPVTPDELCMWFDSVARVLLQILFYWEQREQKKMTTTVW